MVVVVVVVENKPIKCWWCAPWVVPDGTGPLGQHASRGTPMCIVYPIPISGGVAWAPPADILPYVGDIGRSGRRWFKEFLLPFWEGLITVPY
eukprot:837517-Pyramimonas_sp.AAC.1